jgi:hypothetical protein
MKVLFYGGCHAGALRRIFEEFSVGEHEFSILINFSLHRKGLTLPFDYIQEFDWVVFSPVENKPGINTDELTRFCATHGVRTFSYPWLQWNGYFTGVSHGKDGWTYTPALRPENAPEMSFDDFYEHINGDPVTEDRIMSAFDMTTSHLMAHEKRNAVDAPISGLIAQRHRAEQLFLTPDHAALPIYRVIASAIADAIGIKMDPAWEGSSEEPQDGVSLPILPCVARALKLEFKASDFAHSERFRGHLTWREYAEVLHKRCGVYRPRLATYAKAAPVAHKALATEDRALYRIGDAIIGYRSSEGSSAAHDAVTPLLSRTIGEAFPDGRTAWLYSSHWRRFDL